MLASQSADPQAAQEGQSLMRQILDLKKRNGMEPAGEDPFPSFQTIG
jgi:hypothetical protein